MYFHDLGLCNYTIGRFGDLRTAKDFGFIFQNLVFLILRERSGQTGMKLNFWRTTDQAEVDFVLSKGGMVLPIEVKFQECTTPKITRSLRNFIDKYSPKTALVVNLCLHERVFIGETQVTFLPWSHLSTYRLKNSLS